MKLSKYLKISLAVIICLSSISCEDFLEVEAPDHKIVSEMIFTSEETALSAMTGIYNELFRAAYSGGWENSVHVLAGLSADELECIRDNDLTFLEFQQNEIFPNNPRNLALWSSAYSIIYMTNSLLEGLGKSSSISEGIQTSLEGEAKFVRAFTYFYLVNLYGEIPLLLTTDYRENAQSSQDSTKEIYQQILLDLTDANNLLKDQYRGGDRTRVNKFTAKALLARVNLYLENWTEAERLSSAVILNTNTYEIVEDINKVFLSNSKEAIWQISPIGRGGSLSYTNEGLTFIFHPIFSFFTKVRLSYELVDSFEKDDMRLLNWIGYNESTNSHFAFKYKDRSSMDNITEYSMVLRLSEQYLIRAEARARQNKLSGAISDIDKIRKRAGLEPLSENNDQMDKEELINVILEERRKELFTEWGHRWLDLKRMIKASESLFEKKQLWQDTDVLYPIPAGERMKNPNLDQNLGY